MNILIVSQYFWPENFRINDLAIGLTDKGHTVTVLTGIPNYPGGHFFPGYGMLRKRVENYNGIKVIRVPLIPRGKGGALRLALNYTSFAFLASLLAPFYCGGKYDLVFVYEPSPITVGLPAIVIKKLKAVPIMFWVQDLWPESLSATGVVNSKVLLRLVEKLVNFIYRRCDRVLVQSRAFVSRVERQGVKSDRIKYFPNSAEEFYQPVVFEPHAPENSRMPAGFRMMFAGNIGAAQDFATILDAADALKEYKDIHWVIIGDGRMRSWVEGEVKKRGLTETVHLFGRYPAQAMPRFFSLADALLVTLKREPIFALTIPSKVQSYFACAKPVIAVLDGEGARIVEEAGAGLVCPAENPAALAEAVLTMYRMTDAERQEMGLRGRGYFERHFDRTMLLENLDIWIKELHEEGGQCVS